MIGGQQTFGNSVMLKLLQVEKHGTCNDRYSIFFYLKTSNYGSWPKQHETAV